MKRSGDFETTTQRRLDDLQRHLDGGSRAFPVDREPQYNDALGARSPALELLPYIAAGLFFILVGAVTVFGPPPRLANKSVSPSVAKADEKPASPAPQQVKPVFIPTSTPKIESAGVPPISVPNAEPSAVRPISSPKAEPAAVPPVSTPKAAHWADTVAAFQQAVGENKTSDDDAERQKLIDQFRERLNAKNLR